MLSYKLACAGHGNVVGIVVLKHEKPISIRSNKNFDWLLTSKVYKVEFGERHLADREPYNTLYGNRAYLYDLNDDDALYEGKVLYCNLEMKSLTEREFKICLNELENQLRETCKRYNFDSKNRYDDLDL
jgi:hypothetical protein